MSAAMHGKVALVTGGTSGIGRATVRLFTEVGARVLFTGRNEARGAEVVDAAVGSEFFRADARLRPDCDAAVAEALERFGRLDVLFNNAGIVPFGTILETDDTVWDDTLATNVSSVFYMSRAAVSVMREQDGGVIVNNASDWAIVGGQRAAAYCASKGAVVQMTRAMALDHARDGIRVNAVCPGDTYVERWREGADETTFERELRDSEAALPMARVADASEIARAVLFLATEESSYVTGQCLVVDGGNIAGGVSARY
jgi:meso-butanediol dehydrogenase / (S,S)-butanediol dehydrogenase / diacetyl reductase